MIHEYEEDILDKLQKMLYGDEKLVFLMPYEFKNLNFKELKNFNILKFEAYQNLDYDFETNLSELDILLSEYYFTCADERLIPPELLLKLIEIMLIDIASISFVSFSNAFKLYFEPSRIEYYVNFFSYLLDNQKDDLNIENISRFFREIFLDDDRFDIKFISDSKKKLFGISIE